MRCPTSPHNRQQTGRLWMHDPCGNEMTSAGAGNPPTSVRLLRGIWMLCRPCHLPCIDTPRALLKAPACFESSAHVTTTMARRKGRARARKRVAAHAWVARPNVAIGYAAQSRRAAVPLTSWAAASSKAAEKSRRRSRSRSLHRRLQRAAAPPPRRRRRPAPEVCMPAWRSGWCRPSESRVWR